MTSDELCLMCTRTSLLLREQEVAWLESELEHFVEGRRVKHCSTREQRAWLTANKTVHVVSAVAYEQMVDLAETLEGERDAARAYVVARDEEHRRLVKERDDAIAQLAAVLATRI